MVENLAENLRLKGWAEEEIQAAIAVMAEGERTKPRYIKILDRAIYWIALVFTMLGNTVLSLFLIPFVLFAPAYFLYPFLILIGLTFGSLYALILWDIEHIHGASQFMPNVFLPATALINLYVITTLADYFVEQTGIEVEPYSTFFVCGVYVLAFMAPYWYSQHAAVFEKVFTRKIKPTVPLIKAH